MFIKKLAVSLVLLLGGTLTQADQLQRAFTVKQVFSEGASTAGFYPNEALPECKWGLMYVDLNKESGKATFSMLLAAKAASQTIVRIDYAVRADDTCMLSGLHIR